MGDAYLVLRYSVLMEALWRQLCVGVIFCWPVWPWLMSYVCRYSLCCVDSRSW